MSSRKPFKIIRENLPGNGIDLTSFICDMGANFYVFSYEKTGIRKHTFIDSGDSQYRDQILSLLSGNNIEAANIERIIITHRHSDHCGMVDLLAEKSGARICVHSNFRGFVEGNISQEERSWLGNFDPASLKKYDIEYLSRAKQNGLINIHGLEFPRLSETLEIGDSGKIVILGCPESIFSHSPDQLLIFYSPRNGLFSYDRRDDNYRPTDDILFSGDLWLMTGPIYHHGIRHMLHHLRHGLYHMRHRISGKGMKHHGPREQDAEAKEALKRGFPLIRVKPGHGEEFLGSRIIPEGLLANRDLAVEMGYTLNSNKLKSKSKDVESKINYMLEQAYARFINELLQWLRHGYTAGEISGFLVRIYKEQTDGAAMVKQDRKERRERLKEILGRLKRDEKVPDIIHQLAQSTLSNLKNI
jgi:hypothetical protein